MLPVPSAELALMARDTWLKLLSRGVRTPEFEPAVRRQHRRYAVNLGSWRVLFHKGRRPTESRVKLLNASPDGVMLLSRESVPERAPVLVAFTVDEKQHVMTGEVVHCTSTVGGFKVGIKLTFDSAARGHF